MGNRYRVRGSGEQEGKKENLRGLPKRVPQKAPAMRPAVQNRDGGQDRGAAAERGRTEPVNLPARSAADANAREISRCFERDARRYARSFENGVAE